jgi:hypothetical protein
VCLLILNNPKFPLNLALTNCKVSEKTHCVLVDYETKKASSSVEFFGFLLAYFEKQFVGSKKCNLKH